MHRSCSTAVDRIARPSPESHIHVGVGYCNRRDGYLYVPPTYTKSKPSPLLIMFHAAGKGANDALELLEKQQPLLDQTRTIVLLPESRGPTWDLQMT